LATPQRETSFPRRTPAPVAAGHHAASGCSCRLCTDQPFQPSGRSAKASRACASDSTGTNTAEPDPVIRAGP